jgi:AsmA family/AsmA-like C-terminal region
MEAHAQGSPLKKFFPKRVIVFTVIVLLVLFLVRPQFGLLHRKVQDSLSTQLGRTVEMSAVHIRFLPRPGLEIENFTIDNNSDFGAEPLLRSPDVIAYLRVSSLFRGRLEVSGLSFTDASLNLSRDFRGQWNIEELVERTSKSSTAPTGSNRKEARREFPYIEADRARINFKNGVEKTHFALTNAQFSLWQESEDQWGMRLQANPIRTDANLTDTGLITIKGAWRRAAILANTPIQLSFEWKQAQLGQVSKLFYGVDKGWRGDVLLAATIAGTLGKSNLVADTTIDQLRHQDILIGGDLRVVAHCAADYDSVQSSLTNLDCGMPAGDGSLELKGSATGIPFSSYNLMLVAKDASAQFALDLTRRLNPNISQDTGAVGSINLAVSAIRTGSSGSPRFSGTGEILGVRLSSTRTGTELALGTVPLKFISSTSSLSKLSAHTANSDFPELQAGPVNVLWGGPTPLLAQLSITRAGYNGFIRGNASLKRLQQAAAVFKVPIPAVSADGSVTVNLALSYQWGESTPAITGTAQLRSVHADMRGLNAPLQIHRADLLIASDSVKVSNIDASARDTDWRGTLLLARPCTSADSCEFEFHLHSPQVKAATLNQLFNPAAAKQPWYHLLGLGTANSFFARAKSSGSIAIDKLVLGNTVCERFSADLELDKAKLSLTRIHGSVLGGRTSGMLIADFSARPPAYSGAGTFDVVSLETISTLMHADWAEGSGSATYEFKTAGWNVPELLDSADLNSTFRIKDGVFPHVVLSEGADPLHADSLSGQLAIHQGTISFGKTELTSQDGVFMISGTASLAGALKLRLTSENSGGYNVSGTLQQTRVSPIPTPPTQAELKP